MTVELDSWVSGFVVTLKPQLRAAISRLVEQLPPESVVALGAYTDADAQSIVAAADTRAHWEQQSGPRPELRSYFLWSPGEWDLTTVGLIEQGQPDDLAAATAEAQRVGDQVSSGQAGDDDYETFRYMVWEAIVTALGQLFDEGFFDQWPDAVQVFAVPETEIDPGTLAEWMAEMNTDTAARDYSRHLTELYS